MDTAHLPYLSLDERLILRTSERKDIFSEKFSDAESNSLLPTSPSNQSLYGNGDSNVGSEVLETSDRRSVSSGSLSSRTSKDARALADLPRTASSDGRGGRWSSGNTVEEVVTEGSFVDAATTGSLPRSNRPKDTHWFDTKIFYSGHSLNIRVPLGTFPEEIGDVSAVHLLRASSLTVSFAVLPHQTRSDLLQSDGTVDDRSPPRSPTHERPFYASHHPPVQRPRHSQTSRLSRTRTACWARRQPRTRGVRPWEWVRVGAEGVHGANIPLHQPGEPRQLANCVSTILRSSSSQTDSSGIAVLDSLLESVIPPLPIDQAGGTSSATSRRARLSFRRRSSPSPPQPVRLRPPRCDPRRPSPRALRLARRASLGSSHHRVQD
jgi:hypothetical protein